MNKILLSIIMALALVGVADAGFRSSPSVRPSVTRSSPPPTYKSSNQSYAPTVVTPKPASTYRTPTYQQRPIVSAGVSPGRGYFNGPTTVVHEHHYFGGGYGYGPGYYGGYGGGFGNSPWFWLWFFDRPSHQPIVVQGATTQVAPGTGATASYDVQEGPSGWSIFFNVLIGLLMIAAIVALIIWIIRKARSGRTNSTGPGV